LGGARPAGPAPPASSGRKPFVHQSLTSGARNCFPSAGRGKYLFSGPFRLRHIVGNSIANFVENLAQFDGFFSNMNCVDKVPDEVSDEGTKGSQHTKHVRAARPTHAVCAIGVQDVIIPVTSPFGHLRNQVL